jgi:hypothetical protein
MKKSQLRKIIRESIKGLMAEQTQGGPNVPGYRVGIKVCGDDNNFNGSGATMCMPNPITVQIGDIMDINMNNGWRQGKVFVQSIMTGAVCSSTHPGTYLQSTLPCGNCCDVEFWCSGYCGASNPGSNAPNSQGYSYAMGTCWNGCSPVINPTTCDNTMAGSCAQTWLPSNMNWPNMVNFACTGSQTYSAVEQSQLMGATTLLTQNGFTGTIPSFSNYQDISNFVNSTGIGQPQKGQIKRKLAKSHWGGCMFIDCNC